MAWTSHGIVALPATTCVRPTNTSKDLRQILRSLREQIVLAGLAKPVWVLCYRDRCCAYTPLLGCVSACKKPGMAALGGRPLAGRKTTRGAKEGSVSKSRTVQPQETSAALLYTGGSDEGPTLYLATAIDDIPGDIECEGDGCSYAYQNGVTVVFYEARPAGEVNARYGTLSTSLPPVKPCSSTSYEPVLVKMRRINSVVMSKSSSMTILVLQLRENRCTPLLEVRVGSCNVTYVYGSLAVRLSPSRSLEIRTLAAASAGGSGRWSTLWGGHGLQNALRICLSCTCCIVIDLDRVRAGPGVCLPVQIYDGPYPLIYDVVEEHALSAEMLNRRAIELLLGVAVRAGLKLSKLLENEVSNLLEARKINDYAAILDNFLKQRLG